MKQPKEVFTIEADSSMPTSKFKIHDDNLAKVFKILRSNLYSNKILAVIREYSTNGYDANVDNGCGTTPLQITIPTVFEPTFKIRDNGKGLSEHDIFHIYSSYGASTKENTNDQVGTLGMGSKSGFAYANSFTITSYHGGTKSVYEAYIDETEVGAISKMHEEPSDEPTGVEITIAVLSKDIYEFQRTAKEFFRWFSPMPEFKGHQLAEIIQESKNGLTAIIDNDKFTMYNNSSFYYNNSNENLYVKMGNICYPVLNKQNLDCSWFNRQHFIVLNVPIGDVSFTASRESLEMTPMTLETIQKSLEELKKEIISTYQDAIDACKTPFETICHYYTMPALPKSILNHKLIWNNVELPTQLPQHFSYCVYEETFSKQWKARSVEYNIGADKIAVIVNDGGFAAWQTKERLLNARKQLLTAGYQAVYYAKGNITDATHLTENENVKGLKVLTLSSMAPITKTTNAVKMVEKVFKWKGTSQYPYSTNWESVEAKGEKVYVKINSYQPEGLSFDLLQRLKRQCKEAGVPDFEIYGVKKGQAIESDWVTLADHLKKVSDEWFDDNSLFEGVLSSKLTTTLYNNPSATTLYYSMVDEASVNCPVAKQLFKHMKRNSYDEAKYRFIQLFACNYNDLIGNNDSRKKLAEMDKKIDEECDKLKSVCDKFNTMYPLIGVISTRSVEKKMIADYINAMYLQSLQATTPIFSSCQKVSV